MNPNKIENFLRNRTDLDPSTSNEYEYSSMLLNIDISELRRLRRTVTSQVDVAVPNVPLETSIDDPASICAHIHRLAGVPSKPIFGKNIKINQVHSETVVFIKYDEEYQETSRTVSYSPRIDRRDDVGRSRSRTRCRSRTPKRTYSAERRGESYGLRERSRTRFRSFSPRRHEPQCSVCSSRHRNKRKSRSRYSRARSTSRCRFRSYERKRSSNKRTYRDRSYEAARRSRSRSVSSSRSRPGCSHYKSPERKISKRSRSFSPKNHKPGCPLYRSPSYR